MFLQKYWAHPSVTHFLEESIERQRVNHAQLFVGKPGYGTLATAIAYAKALICENNKICEQKIDSLQHIDLHFSIPTFNIGNTKAITKNYIQDFKSLVQENPFASLQNWYQFIDAGNKQGFLSKDEIENIIETLSLKSYEGGYKVMIIWNAQLMRKEYANKFLKLLEEPPPKTLFILITDSPENLLDTITSRCISIDFKPLTDEQLQDYLLEKHQCDKETAFAIAQQSEGDLAIAQQLFTQEKHKNIFEEEFINWTRNAFLAKKDISRLQSLLSQAEKIATWNTEQQKSYLQFCIETFRQALLNNYEIEYATSTLEAEGFNFEKFSQYITGKNIEKILSDINDAHYYLERNANKKLVFSNLNIKLTRSIHQHK